MNGGWYSRKRHARTKALGSVSSGVLCPAATVERRRIDRYLPVFRGMGTCSAPLRSLATSLTHMYVDN